MAGDSIGHSCGQQPDAAEYGSKLQDWFLHNRALKGSVQLQGLGWISSVHQKRGLLLYSVASFVLHDSSSELVLLCLQAERKSLELFMSYSSAPLNLPTGQRLRLVDAHSSVPLNLSCLAGKQDKNP